MMTTDTVERLDEQFANFPISRADSGASDEEIEEAAEQIGVQFSSDYIEFLRMYGGAIVGPYPVFGVRRVEIMDVDLWSVVAVTRHFRSQQVPGCDGWAVISEDHASNPVGLDRDGAIWIYDHDFGGITPLARDFEEYVRVWCLKLPKEKSNADPAAPDIV